MYGTMAVFWVVEVLGSHLEQYSTWHGRSAAFIMVDGGMSGVLHSSWWTEALKAVAVGTEINPSGGQHLAWPECCLAIYVNGKL